MLERKRGDNMRLILALLCIGLCGCGIAKHEHHYDYVTCGDGLTRIQCINYPCRQSCLYFTRYEKGIIVADKPKKPWEVTLAQARIMCDNPKYYFLTGQTDDPSGGDPWLFLEVVNDRLEELKNQ